MEKNSREKLMVTITHVRLNPLAKFWSNTRRPQINLGDKTVTGYCILVMFYNLITALKPKMNEIRFILNVKKAIKDDLSKRINNLGRTLDVAPATDSQFRKLIFNLRADDMWGRIQTEVESVTQGKHTNYRCYVAKPHTII
jgi:hypothetical protein